MKKKYTEKQINEEEPQHVKDERKSMRQLNECLIKLRWICSMMKQ